MARTVGSTKEKSRLRVMEAAVRNLAQNGHKGTTFQSIASEARVSAALVVSHFGTVDKIFSRVLMYVIEGARLETEARLAKETSGLARLLAYIEVSFAMMVASQDRAKIYLMMYYFSLFDPEIKSLHFQIKNVALKRIEAILQSGVQEQIFHTRNASQTARTIHDMLTGSLISMMTSQIQPDFQAELSSVQKSVVLLCQAESR